MTGSRSSAPAFPGILEFAERKRPLQVAVLRGKHRGRKAVVAGYVHQDGDAWPPTTLYLRFTSDENAIVPTRHTRPIPQSEAA